MRHAQLCTLNLLHENRIIVIALLSHTSLTLYPWDVTMFGAYKMFYRLSYTVQLAKKLLSMALMSALVIIMPTLGLSLLRLFGKVLA